MLKGWFFTVGFILLITFSNVWKVSAQSSDIPDAPTNFRVAGGNGTLLINWDVPLNNGGSTITGYRFEWNSDHQSGMLITTSLSTMLESLTNGTGYSLSVAAINSNGVGSSAETLIGVPHTFPHPPGSLTAERIDGILVLNWSAPRFNGGSPVIGYHIESRETGADYWNIEMTNTGSAFTTHNIVDYEFGVAKEFQIAAINQAGMGSMSESLIVEAKTQIVVESESIATTSQIENVTTTTLPAPSTCTTLPPQSTTSVESTEVEPTFSENETLEVGESRILLAPIYVC